MIDRLTEWNAGQDWEARKMDTEPRSKETQVRFLSVTGILLSLVAYLLFLSMPSAMGTVLSTLAGVSALAICFYSLWTWNEHQKAMWAQCEVGGGGK
jgi:hypothetical protein